MWAGVDTHREHQVTESRQDPAAESDDQRTVRGDHKLGRRPHCDSSGQGGVLDVHLYDTQADALRLGTRAASTRLRNEAYHVELSLLGRKTRDGKRGENRSGQGEVSVDGRSVLSVAVVRDGRVETGPEHPEEEGSCLRTNTFTDTAPRTCFEFYLKERTDHSEDVGVVNRALKAVAELQFRSIKDPRYGQTVIGSERVDDHGTAGIPNLGNNVFC